MRKSEIENKPGAKPRAGNPAWVKGAESPNPGGRPKTDVAFRVRARRVVDEKILDRWEREIDEDGPDWVKCSELLAGYGYGKPTQPVESAKDDPDTALLTAAQLAALAASE